MSEAGQKGERGKIRGNKGGRKREKERSVIERNREGERGRGGRVRKEGKEESDNRLMLFLLWWW